MSEFTNALQRADIINCEGTQIHGKTLIMDLLNAGANAEIVNVQKNVFCQTMKPRMVHYKDHHSTMFFPERGIFSVEVPKPKWVKPEEYNSGIVTIYRMNPDFFGSFPNPDAYSSMLAKADEIIGANKCYDIGRLLDDLINTMTGNPNLDTLQIFESKDKQRFVCSYGVDTLIEAGRMKANKGGPYPVMKPWTVLNPLAWSSDFLDRWPGAWDVQNVAPANFSTTDTHFRNEFIRIGRFENGIRKD